jgi:hypothetical protein
MDETNTARPSVNTSTVNSDLRRYKSQ